MTVLDKIEALSDDLKVYFDTNVKLVKLQALDRSALLGSSVISSVIIGVVGLMFTVFLSIAAALYIGVLLESYFLGFGCVAAFYLLTGIVLLVFRKAWLERPIRDIIVSSAMDSHDHAESPN